MKLEGITVGTYTNRKLKTNLKFPIKKSVRNVNLFLSATIKKILKV